MKVLVTGATGLVGEATANYLRKIGHDVLATDIQINTPETLYLDVTDGELVEYVVDAFRPHVIVHLAALVGGEPSMDNPAGYFKININGTLNVLQAIKNSVCQPKLVFTSSWSTYGNNIELPITEATPQEPKTPYGVSKVCCEHLIETYTRLYGVKAIVLRPTMIYGPKQTEKNAVQQVVDCMKNKEAFWIYGKGTHTREFLYVDDMAKVIAKAVDYESQFNREVFVVGTGEPVKICAFAKIAQSVKHFPIKFKDVKTWVFNQASDITKIKETLGWQPQISVEEGLRLTVEGRNE